MIYRSPHPPITVPDVPLTPFLLEAAAGRGDKPAFIEAASGRALSYAAWATAVRRAASGLGRRGFGKGDVLAIFSPNLPEYAIAFHAVSLLGGAATTVNPLFTAEELTRQLEDAGAKAIFTVPACLDKVGEAAARAGLRETFVFGAGPGATPFASLLEDGELAREIPIDPRLDTVALPYSSGTTGLPKGVMLTHHNLVANILQTERSLPALSGEDTAIAVLPFFHIYGLVVIMNMGLHLGATTVTLPRFELEPFLAALQRYGVSFAYAVPPIVLALSKHPLVDSYDLSRLRYIFSGAAPLDAALEAACARRLSCAVLQGYGLTETSPATHIRGTDPQAAKPGSVGPCVASTECKVVDPGSGAERGPGEQGEICVRGPQVMKGYLNRPEATAAMIDTEGWLHTGDIGYADDDGYFYIVDRVKELIKYKGFQIAPAELEAVLVSHPMVADAAVIPVADEEAGEVPKAFVVLKGATAAQEIMDFVASRVAPYKRLRRLEVVDQIPKSPSGKILRRVLKERERGS